MDARDAASRTADVFRGIRAAMLHPVGVDFRFDMGRVGVNQIEDVFPVEFPEFHVVVVVAESESFGSWLLISSSLFSHLSSLYIQTGILTHARILITFTSVRKPLELSAGNMM